MIHAREEKWVQVGGGWWHSWGLNGRWGKGCVSCYSWALGSRWGHGETVASYVDAGQKSYRAWHGYLDLLGRCLQLSKPSDLLSTTDAHTSAALKDCSEQVGHQPSITHTTRKPHPPLPKHTQAPPPPHRMAPPPTPRSCATASSPPCSPSSTAFWPAAWTCP